MRRRQLAVLLLSLGIAILLPTLALAASDSSYTGLVPCGVSSDPNLATSCQACNLVSLVQNLIMFLIGLAIPISMGMFAYAGILYFTQASNTENVGKAKKIFTSTAFGFVLALCAWLIVNTILNAVLDTSKYPDSSWFHIDCTTRPSPTTIGQVLLNHLGSAPVATVIPSYTCDPGYALIKEGSTEVCVNDEGDKKSPTVENVAPTENVGDCSASSMQSAWGTMASAMTCIAQNESACGASPYSTVDKTTTGEAISVGLYQINLSANKMRCGSTVLDCPSAFSGTYDGGHRNITIKDRSLYNQCVQMALNNSCNLQTAQYIYSTQGISAWGTAASCGY
jgi:hypothetical protein